MPIEVQNEFLAGATVRATAYIYDNDETKNTLTDPTSIVIKITDPAGTVKVNDVAMTQKATGVYYYDYTTTSTTGKWKEKITVTDGTGAGAKVSYGTGSFEVR